MAPGWYRKVADNGIAIAQYNLALMYANGEGVTRPITRAVELPKDAPRRGVVEAEQTLKTIVEKPSA